MFLMFVARAHSRLSTIPGRRKKDPFGTLTGAIRGLSRHRIAFLDGRLYVANGPEMGEARGDSPGRSWQLKVEVSAHDGTSVVSIILIDAGISPARARCAFDEGPKEYSKGK
jgi:hypothetical protein